MSKKILELQKKIAPVFKANDVVKASVFGSFARGEDALDSDIDILIELKEPKGLFFLAGLQQSLEDLLGRKVDLLTYKSINPLLKDYILKDEIRIYG